MQTLRIANRDVSPEHVIESANRAANWFRLIGIFSIVNTVLLHAKASITFVIGLGATMVVDAFTAAFLQQAEGGVRIVVSVIGFSLDVLIIGSFFLIWFFARKGSVGAYITGLVFYALDSVIMLAFQDWVGLAFHGFFLFAIFGGLSAMRMRKQATEMLAAAPAIPEPGASVS